jgi:hypothetical protein
MKKLLLACVTFATVATAFGQGQFFFANDSTTRFTTNRGGVTGNMTGANQYRIGLYTAAPGTTDESLFTLVATATNSASPIAFGLFSYPESPFTLAGNNGTPIAVQVRAWSLAGGASYEAAVAAAGSGANLLGQQTPIGTITPAVGGAAPPALFGPGATFTSGIQLIPLVPEPSSIALGLLGLGAIALFRRRK